ncbi:MAG: permease [Candidatus Omnitrophica bacterium]|nr:permease [Candidatus Omnitrophota bacterium]
MSIFMQIIEGGWSALLEYLSAHVLTCLIPAFFIAGAIAVFISQGAVLKYFGPKANKFLSYSVASVSGTILAVCSCTVLPLFGGIYKRGAGIGPAVAFLYSGPAINVLAIVYTARILGYDLGLARAIGAIVFAAGIGLIMALIYQKEESVKNSAAFDALADDPNAKKWWQQIVFFAVLVGILVFAASKNWIVTGILLAALGLILWRWFKKGEIGLWMKETLRFVRLIVPWLLGGVFVAGIITTFVPQDVVTNWVGGNSLFANFVASFLGALMYFATLTEVPIISAFMDLGMGKGPTLALLLAGPALSLPNMLVIRSIMGTKKTLTYVGLVVVMATLTGYIFGSIVQ